MTIITTARKPAPDLVERAQGIAQTYSIPYVSRENLNLETLLKTYEIALVLSRERLSCFSAGGEFFLHPNMAALRIKLLRQGKQDKLLQAMNLQPVDSVLDCTAGLCADSLVIRYGTKGRLVALEQALPIYLVAKYGLENYSGPARFKDLAQGIELVQADYRNYLQNVASKSFDLVYFDPMFDAPVMEAASLLPLRPLACHRPLTRADIQLAARVARRRVVVKQRAFFNFSSLGLTPFAESQNSRIGYGILDVKDDING